jgi:hypothetical protein
MDSRHSSGIKASFILVQLFVSFYLYISFHFFNDLRGNFSFRLSKLLKFVVATKQRGYLCGTAEEGME